MFCFKVVRFVMHVQPLPCTDGQRTCKTGQTSTSALKPGTIFRAAESRSIADKTPQNTTNHSHGNPSSMHFCPQHENRCFPDTTYHSTRFLDEKLATDAGPGAYIHPEFSGNGPAYTMATRPPTPLERPGSPGPGQYISVRMSRQQGGTSGKSEGFGLRSTPRFVSDECGECVTQQQVMHVNPRSGSHPHTVFHMDL